MKVRLQRNNEDEKEFRGEETLQKIQRIEEIIESEELSTSGYILSLIETEDKRFASGGDDGNISICSYDLNKRTWNRDIHKKKAHNNKVTSLCNLNKNRLISGSWDNTIKIWAISERDITLIKEIRKHTQILRKVIPLSKGRFASCSDDRTVRIWDDNTYECATILKYDDQVISILQLKGKEVLVTASGYKSSTSISFWNLNDFTCQETIKGYSVSWSTHMVELPDNSLALSSNEEPYPIVIIDTSSYKIANVIHLNERIFYYSSLCMFNKHSFIYACDGIFLQISNKDGSVLFKSTGGRFRGYWGGIIPLEGGKYFAIENIKKITIVKTCYI
jgi:WD40 repeat protein